MLPFGAEKPRGSLGLGMSYVGPRPLPYGQRSQSMFTADASATLTFSHYEVGLTVANLGLAVANVALPYMAGNLGASNDQSTWVLTSYLVSNAIILPISGWLAGAWGRKGFFAPCAANS